METFRQFVKRTPLYRPLDSLRASIGCWIWHCLGCPAPTPPAIKHATIRGYAKRFKLDVLIETGTYLGDTIAATQNSFSEIYSIELSPELHKQAQKRFRNHPKIHLLQGDSGRSLRAILASVTRPALFWLDAHYSEGITARGTIDTPIVQELETILLTAGPRSVVLIDDARMFNGTNSYPTVVDLQEQVNKKAPNWVMEIKDDIIRLYSKHVHLPA